MRVLITGFMLFTFFHFLKGFGGQSADIVISSAIFSFAKSDCPVSTVTKNVVCKILFFF